MRPTELRSRKHPTVVRPHLLGSIELGLVPGHVPRRESTGSSIYPRPQVVATQATRVGDLAAQRPMPELGAIRAVGVLLAPLLDTIVKGVLVTPH